MFSEMQMLSRDTFASTKRKKESDCHSESKFYTEFMLKNHIGQMVEAHEAILAGSGH